MRIMGIDFGTRRIGVAVSDELLLTAQGLETIQRVGTEKDFEKIISFAKEYGVREIIVGLPLNMNGTHSQKTKEALAFADHLAAIAGVPIKTYDERLTSMQAERVLLAADVSRAKRKKATDRMAAQLILQGYLDSIRKAV